MDKIYEYIASPLFPQWVLNVITAIAAFYAVRAFMAAREQAHAAAIQAQAATLSANTAAEEFALSHRPKLIVRNVVLPIGYTLELTGGSFYVANIGDLPAEITNAHCEVLIAEHLPMRRPYEDADVGNIKTEFIKVNSGSEVRLDIPDRIVLDGNEYKDIQNAIEITEKLSELPREVKRNVYVLGYVRYIDTRRASRRTVFARTFDYRLKRFVPIAHSDYEYAD